MRGVASPSPSPPAASAVTGTIGILDDGGTRRLASAKRNGSKRAFRRLLLQRKQTNRCSAQSG
jgi:hypothetical protein